MTSLSVVCAVFVLHIHHRGGRGFRAPFWLRKFALDVGARLLFMETVETDNWDRLPHLNPAATSPAPRAPENTYVRENGQVRILPGGKTVTNNHKNPSVDSLKELWLLRADRDTSSAVWELVHKKRLDEKLEHIAREWRDISAVIDRILFVFFTLSVLLSTISLLWLQPMAKDVTIKLESGD